MIFEQIGSKELVGYNYFKWCIEDVFEEEGGATVKIEEMGGSIVKIEERGGNFVISEERDGDGKNICNLEKSTKVFEKWIKVSIRMVCIVCVINIIILSILMTNS